MNDVTCPYCGKPATLKTGKEVFPHRDDLHAKNFYTCAACDARVGCHDGTTTPLGTMANAATRAMRTRAHHVFDAIWKQFDGARSDAYAWLADAMNMPRDECHIARMSTEYAACVVNLCVTRGDALSAHLAKNHERLYVD